MAETDAFGGRESRLSDPYSHGYYVVLSDTEDLPVYARALWLQTPGDPIRIMTVDGDIVILENSLVNLVPIRVKRVFLTGSNVVHTSPQAVIALY